MSTRHHLFLATLIFTSALTTTPCALAEDIIISTEGREGRDGTRGRDGANSWTTAGRGGDATNGTDGTDGDSAGKQKIRLEFVGPQQFKATGTAGDRRVDETRGIQSRIHLRARGMRGGDAGDGGNGGQGGKGSRGDDARPRYDGTDGGTGGTGGNAGAGANGGDGGDGGEILLIAPLEDIALFSLLAEAAYEEGRRGAAGSAGARGPGGYGGDGGDGLTWYTTETRKVTRSRQVPYQDTRMVTKYRSVPVTKTRSTRSYDTQPDGSTRISIGSETYTTTESESYQERETYTAYRTEYYQEDEQYQQPHHQAPGRDGRPGSPGLGNSDGRAGATGKRGSFAFVIDYGGGVMKSYTRLFNLRLNPYRIRDENGDGIFEPGERGFVEAIVVENPTEMPTPPRGHSVIRVSLPQDGWMNPDGKALQIEDSVAPGGRFEFDESMAFRIRDVNAPSRGAAWAGSFTVNPQAILDPLASRFSEFSRPVNASVKFPVMFRLDAPPALAQGETGRVRLHVTNVSGATIGGDGSSARLLSMFLKENAEFKRAMEFSDGTDSTGSLAKGVEVAIQNLQPGQTRTIEGTISVPMDFPSQSSYSFDTSLRLGRLDTPTSSRDIQIQNHKLTVATKYRTDLTADIALVINNETTSEELDAWKELLEARLGYKAVTWDTAYYGNFDLDREFISDPRWHLLRDFKQKTVVVLDNEFKTYSGDRSSSMKSLTREAFVRAIGEFEVNFVVLSTEDQDSTAFDPFDSLARVGAGAGSRNYSSIDGMIRGIDIMHRDSLSPNNRAPQMGDFHRVKLLENRMFDAGESHIRSKAELVDRHLRHLWPERRYLVVYELFNKMVKRGFGRPTVHVGDITVQRLPDEGDEVALVAHVSESEMHSRDYILGEENLRRLFAGMHAQQKLSLLRRILKTANRETDDFMKMAGETLVDALIFDVLFDYETALKGDPQRGSLSPRAIAQLRNWRADETIVPGSLAEALVQRLYGRALVAGYYAHGNNREASRSASEDLEIFGLQLFSKSSEWDDFRARVKTDFDAILKQAAVSSWSYNATNYDKVRSVLLSGLTSRRHRVLGLREEDSRVISSAHLEELAGSSRKWREEVGRNLAQDQRSRAELRVPAKPEAK